MFPARMVFCAFKNYDQVRKKYPTRTIEPDVHCKDDEIIVIRRNKKGVFTVKLTDWSVWVPYEFPFFRLWRPKRGNQNKI